MEDTPSPSESPGRPKNSRDLMPRERRTFKPKQKASIEIWAKQAQDSISELLNEGILKSFGKKNMRSLNAEELRQSEMIKFEVLLGMDCTKSIDEENIVDAFSSNSVSASVHNEFELWVSEASTQIERRLTIDEIRNLRAAFYAEKVK